MAVNGTSVLLYANTGTVGVPVWTVVGSQRDARLNEAVAVMDVSTKTAPQRRVMGGRYSSEIELDAMFVPADSAHAALLTNFRARTNILVQVFETGVVKWQGDMLVTKLDREFPDQGPATISISLALDGAWTTF